MGSASQGGSRLVGVVVSDRWLSCSRETAIQSGDDISFDRNNAPGAALPALLEAANSSGAWRHPGPSTGAIAMGLVDRKHQQRVAGGNRDVLLAAA
jgi:hypothetical protein